MEGICISPRKVARSHQRAVSAWDCSISILIIYILMNGVSSPTQKWRVGENEHRDSNGGTVLVTGRQFFVVFDQSSSAL